jgi:hypothetical protein
MIIKVIDALTFFMELSRAIVELMALLPPLLLESNLVALVGVGFHSCEVLTVHYAFLVKVRFGMHRPAS